MASETKTESLDGENMVPLGNGLQLCVDENYPMHPEIIRVRDEIAATNRGKMVVKLAEFEEYLWLNSDEFWIMEESLEDGTFSAETAEPRHTRSLINSLPSLVAIEKIPHILRYIAEGERKLVDHFLDEGDVRGALLKKRRLASILEGLGTVTPGQEGLDFEEEALLLNTELSTTSHPELKFSSRKMHSIFSNIDIRMRRLRRELGSGELSEEPTMAIRSQQLEYYHAGLMLVGLAREEEKELGRENGISGAINEVLVQGRIQDRNIKRGRFKTLETCQSLLWQDNSDGNDTSNSFHRSRLSKELGVKTAFDIWVTNHDTGNFSRIEVKKRSTVRPSDSKPRNKKGQQKQSAWTKEKKQLNKLYAPNIDVIAVRLGRTFPQFCDIAEHYFTGRIALLSGYELSLEEQQATERVAKQVDPQITSIYAKRKLLQT